MIFARKSFRQLNAMVGILGNSIAKKQKKNYVVTDVWWDSCPDMETWRDDHRSRGRYSEIALCYRLRNKFIVGNYAVSHGNRMATHGRWRPGQTDETDKFVEETHSLDQHNLFVTRTVPYGGMR